MIARERSSRPSRIWLVPAGALLTVLALSFILGLTVRPAAILAAGIAIVVAIWAVVQLRAERTAHETALASWAESEAIVAERIRIARDLHDIVSHGLGMITVRAATTRYLNEPNPNEQALLEAIEDVETLSRQTTLELRRMLETLREVN